MMYQLRLATLADEADWMALVERMAGHFPGLELAVYRETLLKNINRQTALCVRLGDDLAGVLLYSVNSCSITFLAVDPVHQRKGVGKLLMQKAMDCLPVDGDIVLTTFREGDPIGVAPRALYQKLGFSPCERLIENNYPCQRFMFARRRGEDQFMLLEP